MKKTTAAFQPWTTAVVVIRTVALLVLLAFIYLFVDNKPLSAGTGTVTPLTVFWKLIVPLVPVILFVVPAAWRNICPLAIFNIVGYRLRAFFEGSAERRSRGRLSLADPGIRLWLCRNGIYIAILLLCVLVPARLFLFNTNAQALALLLLFLAFATFSCGLILPFKAGWCSSICPVYPVENLYGMSPFVYMDNTLCVENAFEGRPQTLCGGCTRHCLDLTVGAAAGASTHTQAQWRPGQALKHFISAFPGFVLAYWLLDSNQLAYHLPGYAGTFVIYAAFAVAMLIFAGSVLIVRRGMGLKKLDQLTVFRQQDLILVALAFNLYYWMAVPGAIETFGSLIGMADAVIFPLSGVVLAGVALLTVAWLRRAW
ncbi:MAG: hypothetical protein K8F91_20800 [Candidatus Obscuribacterales bacterium]|nr:hypothetical protein [Candidatus Obscuribacterales bacterium]